MAGGADAFMSKADSLDKLSTKSPGTFLRRNR